MGCGSSTTTFKKCKLCIARCVSKGYPKTLRILEIANVLRSVIDLRRVYRFPVDPIQFGVGFFDYSQQTRR